MQGLPSGMDPASLAVRIVRDRRGIALKAFDAEPRGCPAERQGSVPRLHPFRARSQAAPHAVVHAYKERFGECPGLHPGLQERLPHSEGVLYDLQGSERSLGTAVRYLRSLQRATYCRANTLTRDPRELPEAVKAASRPEVKTLPSAGRNGQRPMSRRSAPVIGLERGRLSGEGVVAPRVPFSPTLPRDHDDPGGLP
jgi:hypothetical protein